MAWDKSTNRGTILGNNGGPDHDVIFKINPDHDQTIIARDKGQSNADFNKREGHNHYGNSVFGGRIEDRDGSRGSHSGPDA